MLARSRRGPMSNDYGLEVVRKARSCDASASHSLIRKRRKNCVFLFSLFFNSRSLLSFSCVAAALPRNDDDEVVISDAIVGIICVHTHDIFHSLGIRLLSMIMTMLMAKMLVRTQSS